MFALIFSWYVLRKHNKPEEFVQQENVSEENQPKELKILLVEQDEVFGYFFYNMLVQHGSKVQRVAIFGRFVCLSTFRVAFCSSSQD